jgi:molecular chaperone GrpE
MACARCCKTWPGKNKPDSPFFFSNPSLEKGLGDLSFAETFHFLTIFNMADTPSPEQNPAQSPAGTPPEHPTHEAPAEAATAQAPVDPLAQALADVAILQAKVAELQDQYLRGQAEVLNARRRADEEVSKARKFAVEAFADSMLPVVDSLEAGLLIQEATPQQIREGAEATLRQLKSALERNKVIAIDPAAGTKFDPHQHQAISVVPAEQEANTVVTVLQKGYLIAERVLRPALVTVSAPK